MISQQGNNDIDKKIATKSF